MEKFSGDGTDVDFEAWQEVQKKTKSFLNLLFNYNSKAIEYLNFLCDAWRGPSREIIS